MRLSCVKAIDAPPPVLDLADQGTARHEAASSQWRGTARCAGGARVVLRDPAVPYRNRSAKYAIVLRYTTARFHSRITSKFGVPSPNGAPARQPLVLSRLAVEASTSGTLWRKSIWPLPS